MYATHCKAHSNDVLLCIVLCKGTMDEQQLRQFYDEVKKNLTFFNDVSDNATGEDTIALIIQTINKYSHSEFIKYCVKVIDSISKNDFEFCKNLFKISCALVKYRRDPEGHEMVWSPLLLIKVRKGDCKKFTTFICSILKCKGIPSAPKVVNYDEENGWQHIYAIAFLPNREKYLVLDPVNRCLFDTEVQHRVGRVNFYDGTKSKLIHMKLSMMGNTPEENQTFLGLGNAADEILGDLDDISGKRRRRKFNQIHEAEQMYIHGYSDMIEGDYEELSGLDDGIGKPKVVAKVQQKVKQAQTKAAAKKVERKSPEKKAARKEKRQKIVKGAKKVGFAPVRAAFLALIAAGGALSKHTPIKINLAVKLAELWKKDNGKSIVALWEKFGGKRDALKNAIIKASKIQIQGVNYWDGIGAAAAAGLAATVTAASPILVAAIKLLHDNKIIKQDEASKAAALVEDVTDRSTNADGTLKEELVKVVKEEAAPLVQDAIKMDDGGDKQAQKVIKETVTPNDATTPTAPPQQVYTNQSSSSDQQSSSSEQQARTTNTTNTTNEEQQEQPTPQAGGFLLTSAPSWLTGSFTGQVIFNNLFPGHETAAMIGGSVMFLTSIYLFIFKPKP